jgi:hypothetical protein
MNPLILILITVIAFMCLFSQNEDFNSLPYYSCTNCGANTARQCGKCPSCVWSVGKNGISSCKPGDANGPFFSKDRQRYYHNYWLPWYWPSQRHWYGSGHPRYSLHKYYKNNPQVYGGWS